MKKYLLFLFIGAMSLGMTFTSCTKDEEEPVVDARDQYVGTWNYTDVGSLTLYQSGSSIGTIPVSETGTVEVTKSGDNDLTIDGQLFTVNGDNLTSNPESIDETSDGVSIVGTAIYSGTLGGSVITLNNTVTGTWSSTGGNGNLSGIIVRTLTK